MSLINDSFAFCCFHPGSPSTPNCLLSSLLVCMQLPLPWIFKRSRIDLRSAFCCAIFSTVYMGHACSACHNNDSLWCQLRVYFVLCFRRHMPLVSSPFRRLSDWLCLLFPPHSGVSLIDSGISRCLWWFIYSTRPRKSLQPGGLRWGCHSSGCATLLLRSVCVPCDYTHSKEASVSPLPHNLSR